MKLDLTGATEAANSFLKEVGFKAHTLESAQQLYRIVVNPGILGHDGSQRELLVDIDGRVRYFGDVRDLIDVPEDRLKNPDIVEGLIKIFHATADEAEKRMRNYLATIKK